MRTSSMRAKWRALRSAGSSTLKKYLTPPTLSETPVNARNPCIGSFLFSTDEGIYATEDQILATPTEFRIFQHLAPQSIAELQRQPRLFLLSDLASERSFFQALDSLG